MKRRCSILSGLLVAALLLPSLSGGENILNLGSRRELFVDGALIGQLQGSRLQLHAPVPAEQVMTFELPWEGIYSGYCTLIVADGKYRMYYRGLPVPSHTLESEVTCYAESLDGIHWTKPKLGLFEVQAAGKTTLSWPGTAPATTSRRSSTPTRRRRLPSDIRAWAARASPV